MTTEIGKLFTKAELLKARQLYKRDGNSLAIHTEVVVPVMERINKITKQENDSRYIAYAVEFWCSLQPPL